jgi:DNA-binding Lrp family transcriptional regulator
MKYMQELDRTDFYIFNELLADPLQPISRISDQLEIPVSTVRDRYRSMKSRNFLRNDSYTNDVILGKREITEVMAEYSPDSLDLIRHNVFFKGINTTSELLKLIKFMDYHPYTHHRINLFGNSLAVLAQFDIPKQIESKMIEVYYTLKNELGLQDVQIVKNADRVVCNANLTEFSYRDLSWNKGIDIIDSNWQKFTESNDNSENVTDNQNKPVKPTKIDNFDATLLRELTINAKVPIKFLSEQHNRDSSVISRRITKLKSTIIERGLLMYDPHVFDLTVQQVIYGKFRNNSDFSNTNLKNFLNKELLPFASSAYITPDEFLWVTQTSPSMISKINRFIWEKSDAIDLQFYQRDVDTRTTYYFYNENYDENRGWKVDKEYINEEPMKALN